MKMMTQFSRITSPSTTQAAHCGLRTLLGSLLLLAVTCTPALAQWQVQQFEVFAGAPYQRADGVVEMVGFDWAEMEDLFSDTDREQVAQAFAQAASWYAQRGFPEPLLEPVVQTASGPAYRVYVCSEMLKPAFLVHETIEQAKG
ncbi:MAG: hypothetical protein HKN58_10050, partial [Xanthomonadales bacterium]|nr:hypothetical protein [Xanthomonadales bacterium]